MFPKIVVPCGTPKSSILIGFSIINHPFWGPLFWEHPHEYYKTTWPLTPKIYVIWFWMFSKLLYQKKLHRFPGFLWGKFHPGGSNMEDAANSKSSLQRLYLWPQGGALWEVGSSWGDDEQTLGKLTVRSFTIGDVCVFFGSWVKDIYVNHVNL